MTGFSASSGKVSTASTRVLTSSSTRRGSSPARTSIMTLPIPSEALEVISSIPSMALISSSMGMQMPSSTSWGAAPGYITRIWTMSMENSGKSSTLMLIAAKSPPTISTHISRLAATGFFANQATTGFTGSPPRPPAAARSCRPRPPPWGR